MARPLRIAMLTTGIFPFVVGGMQRYAQLLAEHMARADVELTLFHTARAPEAIERACRLAGLDPAVWDRIRVEFVDAPPAGRFPGHYVWDSRRYSRALLDRYRSAGVEADFIYAHGLTGLAFVAARRGGEALPPVAVNAHGYEMFQRSWSIRSVAEQAILRPVFRDLTRDADYVFSFSGRIREIVERRIGVPAGRIIEVPNAIDASWLVSAPRPYHHPRTFLFVGRDDRRKAAAELHAALRMLNDDSYHFHFVGALSDRVRIASPHLTYHGVIRDDAARQAIFDACDVLVCPSYSEGMPTVILEAMARGLAVIATDVGAVREIVTPENGILLAEPRVALIRDAINSVITMPDETLLALKRASLALAPHYGWQAVTARTLAAITEALKTTPPSGT